MGKKYIDTSIFEIFKIGPGPSSSHTIAPLKIGYSFHKEAAGFSSKIVDKAMKIRVELHGSLSATGRGHGTLRAVVGGLLGMTPESCDPDLLLSIFEKKDETYKIKIADKVISLCEKDVVFSPLKEAMKFPYANTMIIKLLDIKNKIIIEKEYYSVGGGFIECKGEIIKKNKNKPKYEYSNFNELKEICKRENLSLSDLVLQNEMKITGDSEKEINKKLKKIIDVMLSSVENGLNSKQKVLPGSIGLKREAKHVLKSAKKMKFLTTKHLTKLNSYALAASEENASGRIVVTAPTSGSSGVIPSVVYYLNNNLKISKKNIIRGMMTASAIAFIAKANASIAGADVGCQGEVGVASAMLGALIGSIENSSIDVIEASATIALEHFLGLTCDPVGGYVQVPCIERNAVGAVAGYNAFILAHSQLKKTVTFDDVVKTMLETGRDMNEKYRETAKGGLAIYAANSC